MTTPPLQTGDTVVMQAEHMDRDGYRVVNGKQADGKLVKANASEASLNDSFDGPAGTYDLTLFAQDESDGQSTIEIFVNGTSVGTVVLDRDSNGRGSNNAGFTEFVIEGVEVPEGASIEIVTHKDGGEYGRIDKLELTLVEPAGEAPAPALAATAAPTGPIVIEAEDMNRDDFRVVDGNQASGGQMVKIEQCETDATLSTTVSAAEGTYALSLFAQDETDGVSSIEVYVDGVLLSTVLLDQQSDGIGNDNGGFTEFALGTAALQPGAQIEVKAYKDGGEWLRIDKLVLTPSSAPVEGEAPVTAPPPQGDMVCVDFDSFQRGDTVAEQYEGVSISAWRKQDGPDGPNMAMVFDSAAPTGGDWDLQTATQGNILIISEDGDSNDPDDNAGGGTFVFDFDQPSFVEGLTIIDIEERGKVQFFDDQGLLIQTIMMPATQDGETAQVPFGVSGVAKMTITLNGSGAIDDIKFAPELPPMDPIDPPVVIEALDDSLTVLESEGAGDVDLLDTGDGSVLVNDTKDGAAYTGAVEGVAGSAANIGQMVAGSNGGLLTINADGSLDFDANGEFDALDVGQSAVTTFTYEIEGGETATVTVTVEGETDYEARDDTMTVLETETAGDVDLLDSGEGSVLANDSKDDGAYAGDVKAVAGDAANVGQMVAGSNGGMLTINADGSLDFDANGEFDALNDGETATTTFTYEIEGGETATVTVNVEGLSPLPVHIANDDYTKVDASDSVDFDDVLSNGSLDLRFNDTTDDINPYVGAIIEVNGDAANMGVYVPGSNGGQAIIYADGTFDFDTNNEQAFRDLEEGQSIFTTFTYTIEGGDEAVLTVEVEGNSPAGGGMGFL